MFLFASLVLSTALAITPLTESAALDSPYRHVRSQDRAVRHLLKRGFKYSYTFRELMSRLEQSDVIVYIEYTPNLPASLDGRMMMLPTSHGQRYVRIQIALRGAPDESVATLGHELQHAIEVAEDTAVRDQTAMTALYERIGMRGGLHVYDTLAAQEVGRTVRRELLG
jgi:hypothetical protein